MGAWKYRAVGLVMIVSLAGTPAVAAACAALCMLTMDHASSMAMAESLDRHDTHGPMPASEAHATTDEGGVQAPGHHHSVAQENERPRRGSQEVAVEVAAASDRCCCASDDSVLTASVAAVRADTGALLVTAAVVATPFHSLIPHRSKPPGSPPIALSPTRAPLVLRV